MRANSYSSWKSYSSLNSTQKRKAFLLSDMSHNPAYSLTPIPIPIANKFNYPQVRENSTQVANQIELMNIKLSFELLQHKITKLNSMILPNDYSSMDSSRLKIESKQPSLSNYTSYSSHKLSKYKPYKMPFQLKDKSSLCSSIDLSQIASNIVDTFDRKQEPISSCSNYTSFNCRLKPTEVSHVRNERGNRFNNMLNPMPLLNNKIDHSKRCYLNSCKEEFNPVSVINEKSQINKYKEESLKIANSQSLNVVNAQETACKLLKNKDNRVDKFKIQKSNQLQVISSVSNQSRTNKSIKETELSIKGIELVKEEKVNDLVKEMGSSPKEYGILKILSEPIEIERKSKKMESRNKQQKDKDNSIEDKRKEKEESQELFKRIKSQIEELNCDENGKQTQNKVDNEYKDEDGDLVEEEEENVEEEEEEEEEKEEEEEAEEIDEIEDAESIECQSKEDDIDDKNSLTQENLEICKNDELKQPQTTEEEKKVNSEDSYDDIFNTIILKAKENSYINKDSSQQPQSTNQIATESSSIKKAVTFDGKSTITISYNSNDPITKLSIYDSIGNKKHFTPVKIDQYLQDIKSPIKLKSIMTNRLTSSTIETQKNKKIALDKLTTLLNECEEKDSSPMKKNISLIQEITKLKKQGKSIQISKPHRKCIPKPAITCKRFMENPQKFFSEDLCNTVLKSYNLGRYKKLNSPRIEKKEDALKSKEAIHKKAKSTGSIMYNIKKYFEEERVMEDEIEVTEEHSIDFADKRGFKKLHSVE